MDGDLILEILFFIAKENIPSCFCLLNKKANKLFSLFFPEWIILKEELHKNFVLSGKVRKYLNDERIVNAIGDSLDYVYPRMNYREFGNWWPFHSMQYKDWKGSILSYAYCIGRIELSGPLEVIVEKMINVGL